MEDRPLFAGQVERLEFDLEQIKAIASPARSEVFWGYSSREPSSVQEVAQGMNRSTGTVHYHTNELVRVGLLIQAGSRKRGARIERLYVHKGRGSFAVWFPRSDEYRRAADKGFHAIMRAIGRERAVLHRVIPHANWVGELAMFTLLSLRLSEADGLRMKSELREVLRRYEKKEDLNGIRIRVAAISHPDIGEMRAAYRAATGEKLLADTEPDDAE